MVSTMSSETFNGKRRKSYARIPDVLPIPDLIKIQLQSYEWFQTEGLRELFDEISPIVSFNKNLELHFPGYNEQLNTEFGLDYRFAEATYTEEECRDRDTTYSAPLYVKVLLYNRETDLPVVQDVYLGDFPIMTENGTFIINGAERVVVSQLIRSPGAYFTVDEDRTTGRQLCMAKLIPNRGAWLEFETSRRDILSVKVDRKRKIPVTVLLRALGAVSDGTDDASITEGSDEELLELFAVVDNMPEHPYIESTLAHDATTSAVEALEEFYKRMRPGDPATLENARSYLESLLFSPRRYDLGRVGRYKLNRRIGADTPIRHRTLTKRDIIGIVQRMIQVNNGVEDADDIDHLGNRRVKTVGELIQNQLRVGFLRMERAVRERMSIRDPEQVSPISLINIRPVVAVVREFFGGSQLSQFMQQTNPLDELTHKRTLSALGPGGLRRERAGFDVRDVHYSHYGRICPIETPEGPNIGLIGRLATYAEVNDYGFVETPYRRVARVVPNDAEQLMGRTLRERVVDPDTGEVIADSGTVVDAALAAKLTALDVEQYRVQPYVTDEVQYLSADEEEHYVIAQANTPLDEKGQFLTDRVSARVYEKFLIESVDRVSYMDVSPKQVVGISAALIPFLEHDDANRALMGSNMQRQAVPLLLPEAPIVGTGMEFKSALDSGQVLTASTSGEVVSVSAGKIVVQNDDGQETYYLRKYDRSNQSTCIDQRPVVDKGTYVEPGDVIADSSSTENGELALGQNVLCAFMSWEGGNYEDAILVSENLVRQDKFSSVHIEKYEIEARDTKLGPEEITRDIPNVGEDALRNLDEEGIIYVGAEVGPGDILVGKITPKGETELTPEEKLLRAIFGEKAREVKDSSLRLPHGEEGKVVDVRVFTRDEHRDMAAGVEKLVRVSVAQRRKITEGDKMAGRHGNKGVISQVVPIEDMPYLSDGTPVDIILNPLGVPARMNVGQILETHLGYAAQRLGFRLATPVSDGADEGEISAELARAWLIDRAWRDLTARTWPWLQENEIDTEALRDDDQAREIYFGNFLADQGMAYGEIERILADPEVARRTWLEIWLREQGYEPDDLLMYDDDLSQPEDVREESGELAREVCLRIWLSDEGIAVDGLSRDEVFAQALDYGQRTGLPLPTTGKMVLYDGKTGQPFDRPVTVGIIYMLKLAHLVQDKVHARSTGPYSLVTQQPLGGKAQFGGQRFGEMEVWALEAYGAAHTLQEMLTIKSDDVTGRVKTYEAIVKGEPITESGVPESFSVLIKELQALGLSVEVYDDKGESVQLARDESLAALPSLGLGLGFGSQS
ncbi:MAG TPA: DNA-directed RNA polymerase subunit beta [Chloroflexi bacterium]|jgi:DNA-directed RNA polymerase subunit beta|nr:DNA-directed RNA polymerase subunit beta [Chloroflexota bacterium]